MSIDVFDRVLGVVYGQAIGDAMGMPPELWSRSRLKREYPDGIHDFLDGHPDNAISYQYVKGQFTDDTAQALILIDSLMANDFEIVPKDIADRLIRWAVREDAFEKNILGPTSKAVLQCYIDGRDPSAFTKSADTNGAAMRVSPLGALFHKSAGKDLCDFVGTMAKVTHASDIAIASACMPAMAAACLIEGDDRDAMIRAVTSVEDYARSLGNETPAPYISDRLYLGVEAAQKYADDEEKFSDFLYRTIGTGHFASETAATAIAIAYYCMDVKKAALLCANLGGDTDTIGAITCAICGAVNGKSGIPASYVEMIDTANDIDLNQYGEALFARRGKVVV